MSQIVLITGCSSGIGRDLARRLSQSGYTVAATARNVETLEDLPAAVKLALDVTQPGSVSRAVDCVIERFGRIDVLVNNAGYAAVGAVEEVPVEEVQELFDANLFGSLRMIRAVVPHMRKQGSGRIINISSIAGRKATPVNWAYSAAKTALEALSDSLRWELAPFGIKVVAIEPGSIKTRFGEKTEAHAQAILGNPASPYRLLYKQYQQFSAGMQRNEPGPEAVSRVIQHVMEVSRPKARYLVAIDWPGRLVLHLGDSVWDLVVRRMFKIGSAAA
jgi:NAD(P)-dependent dehydrogenase (short-subunit alcohol dehydrogenase family)